MTIENAVKTTSSRSMLNEKYIVEFMPLQSIVWLYVKSSSCNRTYFVALLYHTKLKNYKKN